MLRKMSKVAIGTLIEMKNQDTTCYGAFLEREESVTKLRLSGSKAADDFQVFRANSLRLTTRMSEFLNSQEKEIAYLVLGRVQSGKTAHLLSTLAWAVDSKVSFATVFTGITGPLNIQTAKRIESEFKKLQGNFVKVLRVPTKSQSNDYEQVRSTLFKYVEWRITGYQIDGKRAPLPILVTMKNSARIATLKTLFSELAEKYGEQVVSMMIDDEADQASQNAGVHKNTTTRTYRDISHLRDVDFRNIMLSYTATPQAVLHAPKRGRLRPDYCVRVEPRQGYFGLEDITDPNFAHNVISVEDWDSKTLSSMRCPKSLTLALQEFIWICWIRKNQPKQFYSQSSLPAEHFKDLMKSCQMLIHQSVQTDDHHKVHRMVMDQINSFSENCREIIDGSAPKPQVTDFIKLVEKARDMVFGRISEDPIKPLIDNEFLQEFFEIIESTKIFVVNASSERPGLEETLPSGSDDEDGWDERPWILIGGDMLGRGLTIPQLVSTYFLRMSSTPNFDTVSQQMRFCGYRKNYAEMCVIYAPDQILNAFNRMRSIDAIMWNRAGFWDEENLDLKAIDLTILYAVSGISMDPTRKSVRDPNLYDESYSSENLFSPKRIFSPLLFKNNIRNVNSWMNEVTQNAGLVFTKKSGNFLSYSDIDDNSFLKLLSMIDVDSSFEGDKLSALELLNSSEANFGLSHLPKYVYISEAVKDLKINSIHDANLLLPKVIGRSSSAKSRSISTWYEEFRKSINAPSRWSPLGSPHIGGAHRSLYLNLNTDCILLVIEPVKAWQIGDEARPFALGLASSIILPKNFKIRTIGFR